MQDDPRSEALTRNFVGQWLEVRDVDGFTINTRAVLRQEGSRARIELDGQTRRAMRGETEMVFAHIVREDRSVLELIDSDYTFLNAKLAELYGIKDVTGTQMRKVSLPKDSPRGGVLDARLGASGDVEPDPNVAGEARPVHPREPAGHARHRRHRRSCRRSKTRRSNSRTGSRPAASCWRLHRRTAVVRLVPRPDGPARAGARELQRDGPLAR